jgi:uncharacterized integral membrane protein (TIGR00698 family)
MEPAASRAPDWRAWSLCLLVAVGAYFLRHLLREFRDVPGPAILALIAGVILGNFSPLRPAWTDGCGRVIKRGIPYAILLIGAGLDLSILSDPKLGLAGLLTVILTMVVAFASSLLFARLLGLSRGTGLLLGAGTAICGNSAIVAVAPVVKARDEEMVLSLGVINLLGVLVMLAVPPLVRLLGLTAETGGVIAGTTVHAVPQAIAAGDSLGERALELATLFKLVRVALLAPMVVLIAMLFARGKGKPRGGLLRAVPWFIWGFVAMAALKTVGWLDWTVGGETAAWEALKAGGKFLLAVVMAAVGIGIRLRAFLRIGPRALAAGALATAAMLAVAVALQG